MKRFIDDQLVRWKRKKRRKPLIIRGTRQVGKTYAAVNFGKKHFNRLAVIDLERNPEWHKIFGILHCPVYNLQYWATTIEGLFQADPLISVNIRIRTQVFKRQCQPTIAYF